ncbi:hypothetical protein FocTR4_00010821 [Fusarium oxysporum f. sp. cubense]|uniref:Rhodopsin domain-containing protein n=1 Tax=Fusarium oxysporum f. sp. cubense TaxID=61366 RepID=A0A5C6T598_FUSOC|nr:hypothetical protein FocTR4_00010821 [Fusarium oxysporum f. sp. cubense]
MMDSVLFTRFADRLSLNRKWIETAQFSAVDAEMCLAMALCSDIERLKIQISDDRIMGKSMHFELLYTLLDKFKHEKILPNLRHVDIDKSECFKFSLCDPEPILLMRAAPRLETLILRGPGGETYADQNSDSDIQEFCSGVRNITEFQILGLPFFTGSTGSWQTLELERILGAAQNLNTFNLTNPVNRVPQPTNSKTLQRLSLNLDSRLEPSQRNLKKPQPITPQQIKQFTNLTTLEVDSSCYYSHTVQRNRDGVIVEQETYLVDFLPQAVQNLTIFFNKSARYEIMDDITYLGQRAVAEDFPKLKRVQIDAPIRYTMPGSDSWDDDWDNEQLAKLSAEMDVRKEEFQEAFVGSGVDTQFRTCETLSPVKQAVGKICLAIGTGLVIFNVTLGFGKDMSEVDPAVVPKIALTGTIFGLFAVLSAAWSKTSFALTLIRLVDGWMSWFLWFLIIATNITMDLVIVFSFVKCTPAKKVWHSNLPGTCWNPMVATYYNIFAGAFSGLVDLILCVIAWTIIWKLSMRTREKIGVGIALTFGVFAAATAAAKCYKMLGLSSKNRTLDRVGIIIWGTTECAVTIMAASIPVMRILVLRVYRRTPDQISNRPLRTLRVISTLDKRASTNNTMPSYNTEEGANMLTEEGLRDLSLPSRTISARQNDIGLYEINGKG